MTILKGLNIAALSLVGLLTACAAPINHPYPHANSTGARNFYALKPSPRFIHLNIKGYQQTEDYTCGPAAVMTILRYYNKVTDAQMTKATELRIAQEMGSSSKVGTSPGQIAHWLKQHGFKVTLGTGGTIGMLKDNLHKGIPTLVEWIDWGGHWVVVNGYYTGGHSIHEGKDTLFFADPSASYVNTYSPDGISSFEADRFNSMWFDAQYFRPGHIVKGIYIIATPISKSS